MTFPKLSGFIYFSKTFPGLEIAVLKFHDFSRFFMTVRTLYKSIALYFNIQQQYNTIDSSLSSQVSDTLVIWNVTSLMVKDLELVLSPSVRDLDHDLNCTRKRNTARWTQFVHKRE